MKRSSIHLALLLAVLIAFFQGCATTSDLFNNAAQLNTVESYQAFIRENPESPLVSEAQARIESLHLEIAKQLNTINAYEEFLGQHPGSRYADEAQAQLEALYFQEAGQRDTAEAFQDFLKSYPTSRYAYEAQARIESLDFERAKQLNTITAYEEFLIQHSVSPYADEAQAQLEALYFQEAQQTNTIEAYQEYLKRYPDGRFANQSQENIKELGAPETPYVLYFYFAPGCPHCRAMAPVVEDFYQEYGTATKPGPFTDRAFPDEQPIHLAARDADIILRLLVQIPEAQAQPKTHVQVIGVLIPDSSWDSDVEKFKRTTGINFPIGDHPGRAVDTSNHPVIEIMDKRTAMARVISVGEIPYSDLDTQVNRFIRGKQASTIQYGGSYCSG